MCVRCLESAEGEIYHKIRGDLELQLLFVILIEILWCTVVYLQEDDTVEELGVGALIRDWLAFPAMFTKTFN